MIRFLPFILIAVVVLGGMGYWRYVASKPSLGVTSNSSNTVDSSPIEVPKTLPAASLEDRVIAIESLMTKVVSSINSLKSSISTPDALSADVIELKARVSALEAGATSAPASSGTSSKSTIYIPLGSGGIIESTDWTSINTFLITLDPSQYPGYTSMQLEVNMRLNVPGTVYARLYNNTSGSATSLEATSTSTVSSVVSSSNFTLPAGSKSYVLQAKTSGSKAFLDYARIKVNF